MAARRYEISLGVLKNALTGDTFFCVCYINTNETLNHFTKGIERRDFYM